ncbi:hypothetical protein SAMN05660841_03142 [Sphingobacterium nematocida]|uniref:Uncharacterized protein n=1 Tax=Sphingobacterium nematocida TaxID=1513896 RepID=A0A1T5FBJ4_9SPHI|nr:hypothetical protein [Sphingobacterium nematocida]SKB93543.1 hypothetical protein SAMN05660841_03142 [Sphingobacterium nematocida]
MMNMILTEHALRTIILEFDESKEAPEFETKALDIYYEMHNRTWLWMERLRIAREKIPALELCVEKAEELWEEANCKLEHLLVMIPQNPERPRVKMQLKMFTEELNRFLCDFVPDLIDQAADFYEYDTFTVEEDTWLSDVAFKQFRAIFDDYKSCKVDMVSFDRDLDDFKGVLGHMRKREGKYYETMNGLIDTYDELNNKIDVLHDRISEFDNNLLEFFAKERSAREK